MIKKLIIFIFIAFSILIAKKAKIEKHLVKAQSSCTYSVSNNNELQEANSKVSPGETVCLKPGTYTTPIRPSNSGVSEGQRIVYKKEDEGNVVLTDRIDLSDRSYITISGLNVKDSRYVNLNDSDHCVIENGRFSGVTSHPGIDMRRTSYAVIRNNFIGGREGGGYIDVVQLLYNAHHNLIEGNYFEQLGQVGDGPHTNILLSGDGTDGAGEDPHHNIIRNNTFYNEVHHCINVQGGSHHNIFEGNTFSRCGKDGEAWHAWQSEGIYRFNVVTRVGGQAAHNNAFGARSYCNKAGGNTVQAVNNRIYHNNFYHNGGFAFRLGLYGNCEDNSILSYKDNKFLNNIIYENNLSENRRDYSGSPDVQIYYERSWEGSQRGLPQISGEEWRHNLIGRQGEQVVHWLSGDLTLEEAAQLADPAPVFTANIQGDPEFIDSNNDDYHLSSSSPCINQGDFLTFTTSAGSGVSLPVADARFFSDGYGIVEADAIQMANGEGNDGSLKLVAVDYTNNVLTLNRPINWEANTGITMPYKGSRPDIGAFEYIAGTPPSFSADLNKDGVVNSFDLAIIIKSFAESLGDSGYNSQADINSDGTVDAADFMIVAVYYLYYFLAGQ